jgi:hypothetical protein
MLTMWRVSSHLYLSTMGMKLEVVLSPGHHVPAQRLVAGAAFRLKGQRVADLFAASEKPAARRPACRR